MPREYFSTASVRGIGHAHAVQQPVDAVLGDLVVDAVEPRRVAQVLATGHAAVEADVVGQIADVPLDGDGVARRIEVQHARAA